MFEPDVIYDSRRLILPADHTSPTTERPWVRRLLIGIAVVFMAAVLVLPLVLVFTEALRKGAETYFAAFADRQSQQAIILTLLVAAIAVPLNLVFGVAAAWCVAKYEFWGKSFLTTLIDLPFSVSPVVSGMVYVLLFGAQSALSPLLKAYNIEIIFAVPGIVLATIFVTFPFIARELIPLMQDQGISAARPPPCRSISKSSTMSTTSPPPSPSLRCWLCWHW